MSTQPTTVQVSTPTFLKAKIENLYCMYYRRNGEIFFKVFHHEGNRASAIERAIQHCQLTARKHLYTTHFIHDLDLEEQKVAEGTGADNF